MSLVSLPKDILKILSQNHVLKNAQTYQSALLQLKKTEEDKETRGNDLFSMTSHELDSLQKLPEIKITSKKIIWGTDNYENKGNAYSFSSPIHDVSVIVPRADKSKAEQKRRVKEKAEVFTPFWVCNLQNNLIDDSLLGEGSFNIGNEVMKTVKLGLPSPVK